ncbi:MULTISPECIES: hypothetical protein [Microbacterium]|uniref:hypothetical protein n=1 Tax=Microbacterium TaxID=33882 RepID=UPI00146C3782|nr:MULTISPECIES: hypothetical protein [Microbacterium]
MNHRRTKLTTGICLTTTLLLIGSGSAYATPAPPPGLGVADVVAAHVADVAPDPGHVVDNRVSGGASVTELAPATVEVPLGAPDEVVVTVEGLDGEIETSIELPEGFVSGAGAVADDGTVVFGGEGSTRGSLEDAIAIQTLADGSTRVQTILADAQSDHEFGYRLEGFVPHVASDGSAYFISDAGDVVPVGAAWAVDANGDPVSTRYVARGDELIQVVDAPADVAYPIVADPSWRWINAGWGMKLTRDETRQSANYAMAGTMCAAFVKNAPALGIACGVYAGYIAAQAAIANGENPKTCLFFNAVPAPGTIWRVTC